MDTGATNIIVTFLSIIFSGVIATVITILYQKRESDRIAKQHIFETAVAYRFRIHDEVNVKSLNSICVVFHNNKNVIDAWQSFMNETDRIPSNAQTIADKYIKLLEEMAVACGYEDIKWDNLKPYYYPTGLLNRTKDAEMLVALQIQAAEKTISQGNENTKFSDQRVTEMLQACLPQILANPEGFKQLYEIVEKQKK